ncbi:hypothetical protein CRUP_030261, partial [Coryphaenoides rupestris]
SPRGAKGGGCDPWPSECGCLQQGWQEPYQTWPPPPPLSEPGQYGTDDDDARESEGPARLRAKNYDDDDDDNHEPPAHTFGEKRASPAPIVVNTDTLDSVPYVNGTEIEYEFEEITLERRCNHRPAGVLMCKAER